MGGSDMSVSALGELSLLNAPSGSGTLLGRSAFSPFGTGWMSKNEVLSWSRASWMLNGAFFGPTVRISTGEAKLHDCQIEQQREPCVGSAGPTDWQPDSEP
jgi:hypothetical protein